ncbi:PREDICTED: cytochrome P450 4C1-like [Wasmannia auropunctata]|uniref:cytochrome P450 4C1-like n=1 Tax=Wasmannia auropunctata TaxID=64793 RepID=UPI0005EFE660|nr:PREDICTED: cytochrome P450 4C1-like [Wasmannia auropunctata]
MIIISSILSIFIILVYNYYRRNGRLINRIPGPPGYPITENFLNLLSYSREEQLKFVMNLHDQYYPIYKIWGIYFPIVFIRHPDDLKTILSSPKHISKKTMIYKILYPWLRTGLFTSSGNVYIRTMIMFLLSSFHYIGNKNLRVKINLNIRYFK